MLITIITSHAETSPKKLSLQNIDNQHSTVNYTLVAIMRIRYRIANRTAVTPPAMLR